MVIWITRFLIKGSFIEIKFSSGQKIQLVIFSTIVNEISQLKNYIMIEFQFRFIFFKVPTKIEEIDIKRDNFKRLTQIQSP